MSQVTPYAASPFYTPHSAASYNAQQEISPALQNTADNSTLAAIAAFAISSSTLAIGLAYNFAAALCHGLPLASLLVYIMMVDDQANDTASSLAHKDIRHMTTTPQANTAVPLPVAYPVATVASHNTTAEGYKA